jgi:hypothetical protein
VSELMILPSSALAYAKTVVRRKGHAAHPGSGPKGETCGSCEHRKSVQGGRKTFSKCELMRAQWTAGPGSDIRKKDPACVLWKAVGS